MERRAISRPQSLRPIPRINRPDNPRRSVPRSSNAPASTHEVHALDVAVKPDKVSQVPEVVIRPSYDVLPKPPVQPKHLQYPVKRIPRLRDGTFFDLKPAQSYPQKKEPPRDAPAHSTEQVNVPSQDIRDNLSNLPATLENTPVAESMTATMEDVSNSQKKNRNVKWSKPLLLQLMASILFIAGMYVVIDGWLVNRAAQTQAEVLAAKAEEDSGGRSEALDEKEPANTSGYHVAPELPRMLSVPSLGVSARVLHVGVNKDNSMVAPTSIFDTGWYTGSARPTDTRGAMLVDGHVSGPTKRGVFYNIKTLKVGDEIVVEKGDKSQIAFVVKEVETVKAEQVDMAKMLRSVDPDKLGLNLITCGGRFDTSLNLFESRVLVYAALK